MISNQYILLIIVLRIQVISYSIPPDDHPTASLIVNTHIESNDPMVHYLH